MGKAKSRLFVYQTIIIVFVLLLIPIYFVNLFVNLTSLSILKEQMSRSVAESAQFYSKQLDDQITFIRNQQLQLLDDANLQKLSFMADTLKVFDEYMLVNQVEERLGTISNSSSFIANAEVYIRSLDRFIRLKGSTSNLHADHPKSFLFAESFGNRNDVVVYIELSRNKMIETLRQLVNNEHSGALLISDDLYSQLAVSGNELIIERIEQMITAEPIVNKWDQQFIRAGNKSYFVTSNRIPSLGMTMYTYTDQDYITRPLSQFNQWILIMTAISVIVIITFAYYGNKMIHKPLKKLVQAFKSVEMDKLDTFIDANGKNEFGYLYRSFNKMVERLRESISQGYEQKIALQRSELKQLQSQINPHFLYNGFFSLYIMCKTGKTETASIFAHKLGSYYQYITRSGKDEVPLVQEYKHALDYCDIQSIRFSGRVHISCGDLPEQCENIIVPRLIIQPLLENAFEHAFDVHTGQGNLVISFNYTEGILVIAIEDDGYLLSEEKLAELGEKVAISEKSKEKTGLLNVSQRLKLKYGEFGGINVSRSSLGGLKTELLIPARLQGGSIIEPIINR